MNAHQPANAGIEFAKAMYAAFGRGDIATIVAGSTPDVVWRSNGSASDFPTLGSHKGPAEFFALVAEHDAFTSFEPRAFYAAGDKVFVEGHYGITAKKTGKHFEADWLHVITLRDGKTASFVEYTDTGAFAAAYRA